MSEYSSWRPTQVRYWHTQYEGSYVECPDCGATLSIAQALDDGCADCKAGFTLAYKSKHE